MKEYFNFTKNELILFIYLSELGEGNYELLSGDFLQNGMPRTSFYNGRDGLENRGYLKKISTNYYHFSPNKVKE